MTLRSQLTHIDPTRIQPAIALRNATGVAIPLALSIAAADPRLAFLGSLGAMNAALSDGSDPYLPRGRRMFAAACLSTIAVSAGAIAGAHPLPAGLLILLWSLLAGLLVALDQAAADIGLLSLVMVLVFLGQPMTPPQALTAGAIALAGGLLQTLISVVLWPLRRYEPECRVIAALYAEIAAVAASPIRTSLPPPASIHANEAQAAVRSLGRTHTVQGDRYVSLVSQAERIRLALLALRDAPFFPQVSLIASAIARKLRGEPAAPDPQWFEAVAHPALAGQLRAAWELAASSTLEGRVAFERRQLNRPWRLRVESTAATLRANLTLRSPAMRHALRLAATVLAGELLAWATGGKRSYWLPMTAAIVLKPDFTATFSRGLLRIAGTFTGLALATALFSAMVPSGPVELALIVLTVFVFRWIGPANYGIFTASLTAYIVMIFALAGQPPGEVIRERALHTVLGGALALIVYALWPTWERTHIRAVLADMLDAYRLYFRAAYEQSPRLETLRLQARLARSNAEAAMDRFVSEPQTEPATAALIAKFMASSHRVVFAMVAIEAGHSETTPPFLNFAHKVEIALHSLAAALRGAPLSARALPDLRSAQIQLAESAHPLAGEADRLTNSLNTLAEHTVRL